MRLHSTSAQPARYCQREAGLRSFRERWMRALSCAPRSPITTPHHTCMSGLTCVCSCSLRRSSIGVPLALSERTISSLCILATCPLVSFRFGAAGGGGAGEARREKAEGRRCSGWARRRPGAATREGALAVRRAAGLLFRAIQGWAQEQGARLRMARLDCQRSFQRMNLSVSFSVCGPEDTAHLLKFC